MAWEVAEFPELVRDTTVPIDPTAPTRSWPLPAHRGGTRRYVYVIFGADKSLLYVGYTHHPRQRLKQHRVKPWWPLVRWVQVQEFATEDLARRWEAAYIAEHRPLYNVRGT